MVIGFLQIVYVVVVVLLLFNLTIFIHELGHYLVGRWRGAKIERFAVWFGPALWSKTIQGVEWRLGCIPLGGYVAFPQLAMEAVEGKSETPAEEMEPLRPRDKIPILFAGSIANIFLAIVVACIVWVVGLPRDKSSFDLKIGYVGAGSPEHEAGIRPGDEIVSINGKLVKDWEETVPLVALSLSREVRIEVLRGGERKIFEVEPDRDHLFRIRKLSLAPRQTPIARRVLRDLPAANAGILENDEFLKANGEEVLGVHHMIEIIKKRANQPTEIVLRRNSAQQSVEVTPRIEGNSKFAVIGVELSEKRSGETESVHETPWVQITKVVLLMADTLNAILHKKTTGVEITDLSGPLGIVEHLYTLLMLDFRLALYFLVILNVNLAIVNLLPIPVLDGGHVVFAGIEAIRRKPMNPKFMEATNTVFIVLIMGFMLYITVFGDIARLARRVFPSSSAEEATVQSGTTRPIPTAEPVPR